MKRYNKQLEQILSILPGIKIIKARGEADYYGISRLIAKKLGLPFVPRSSSDWRHGWQFIDLKYPEQMTYGNNNGKKLVFSHEHAEFLNNKGLNAKAIGAPFIYVEDIVTEKIERIKNSLLIMPPHSLPYTEHQWDEDLYAKQINDLKNQFELIVVCIHQSCIQKKLWVSAFEKYDIPYIIGADALDENSLIRMYKIFNSFEFMTTNSIGSHVPYAAYCGCKVSIYGDYVEYSKADYDNAIFYQQYPLILDHNLKYSSEKSIKTSFPYLFCSPIGAILRTDWAEEQLGKCNKVTFYTLAKLLGWLPQDQFVFYLQKIYSRIKRKMKEYLDRNNSIDTI